MRELKGFLARRLPAHWLVCSDGAIPAAVREAKNQLYLRQLTGGEIFSRGKLVIPVRIALANIRFPTTPDESITLATEAIDQASIKGARIICFPECFVPGYRGIGKPVPPPDPEFLEGAAVMALGGALY
jgi:hypothetical protein